MNIKKKRENLTNKLREANLACDYIKAAKIMKELSDLDDYQIQSERVSYGDLARRSMTEEESEQFTADLIAMIMACDILQKYTMQVESHLRKFENFISSDIIRLKQVHKILGGIVKMIDNCSNDHPIIDKDGKVYKLSDHYMYMVDEVESKFLGLENVIHNVIKQHLNFARQK